MQIDAEAYVHTSAVIIGNVEIGAGSSVWPGAVLRGDYHSITLGRYSSLQDNSVVHPSPMNLVRIGDWVTVGHSVVIHGSVIEDYVLVGIRSVLLDGVVVGAGSMIAAGTLVPEGMQIPPDSFVSGSPAVVKPARPGTRENNRTYALSYHLLSRRYMEGNYLFTLDEVICEIKEWNRRSNVG